MDKKSIVTKTYGSSWVLTIILAIVVGIIGALICPNAPLTGFLAGLVLTIVTGFIAFASFIPFVGVYLYWIWSKMFYDWLLGIVFTGSNYTNMMTLTIVPLVISAIFGIILCLVTSFIVVVIVGAGLGAIFG
jgi:hypothetical protein